MYRVHIGYTAKGHAQWRKFETLEQAKQYCEGYFQSSGIILTIIEV